ncbi:hypothetical protein NC653_038919 [Populus alba x Populus x berolinensis]|uniref:Uncharacterized protein n=1 Tax=Populus alba x Populus x berolinensis TaxID=444605 RepID=A0AAD6LA14_9ROSI|nr:uncharacterized protein LOC118059454 [Populus alba]XP_034928205.1 uncharacterized protein LOC118059454 [Populus alba]KAJ6956850.1 hypothetical protein NC653_038919 [Populus alba x Populus x berolinensis]
MPLARYENSMGNRSLSPWQRSELYYCMMRSTVVIDCKIARDVTDKGRTVIDTRRGGGVILNEQGLILTSLRLVHEVSSISATLSDMTTTYEATLVFDIVNSDLALIKISELEGGQRLMYAQISPQVLDVGQEVLSIGSSYQLPPFQCSHSYANELVTFGTQNVLNEEVNWSAHDFPEMIYMIGSPVYDSSGKIVALQQGHNSHHAIGLPGEKLLEFYLAYNG